MTLYNLEKIQKIILYVLNLIVIVIALCGFMINFVGND